MAGKKKKSVKKKSVKNPKKKTASKKTSRASAKFENPAPLYTEIARLKKQISDLSESKKNDSERIQDLEICVNLITRLLTTLCIEKFGMRVGVLKRLIKQAESEAIRDSQIVELENIYELSNKILSKNKKPPSGKEDKDPWDDIS